MRMDDSVGLIRSPVNYYRKRSRRLFGQCHKSKTYLMNLSQQGNIGIGNLKKCLALRDLILVEPDTQSNHVNRLIQISHVNFFSK